MPTPHRVGLALERWAVYATGPIVVLYLRYLADNVRPVSALAAGAIASGFVLLQLIGAPVVGMLSDRWGRRRLLLIECAVGVIVSLAYPMMSVLLGIFVLQALQGLTVGAAPVTLSHLARETSGSISIRGRRVALFEIANLAALGTGVAFGGKLWDTLKLGAFDVLASAYAASFIAFASGSRADRPNERDPRRQFPLRAGLVCGKHLLAVALPWVFVSGVLAVWGSQGLFQLTGQATDGHQRLVGSLSGTDFGYLFAGAAVVSVVATYIWGLLLARLSEPVVMLVSAISVLGLLLLVYLLNRGVASPRDMNPAVGTAVVIGFILCLAGSVGFAPAALVSIAQLTDRFTEARGAIMGLFWALIGMGRVLGIWSGGIAAQVASINGMIVLSAVLTLLALVAALRLAKTSSWTTSQSIERIGGR